MHVQIISSHGMEKMKRKPEQELLNSPYMDMLQFEAVETSYYLTSD